MLYSLFLITISKKENTFNKNFKKMHTLGNIKVHCKKYNSSYTWVTKWSSGLIWLKVC